MLFQTRIISDENKDFSMELLIDMLDAEDSGDGFDFSDIKDYQDE